MRDEPGNDPALPELALHATLDDGTLALHERQEPRREPNLVEVEHVLVLPRLAQRRRRLDAVPERTEVGALAEARIARHRDIRDGLVDRRDGRRDGRERRRLVVEIDEDASRARDRKSVV